MVDEQTFGDTRIEEINSKLAGDCRIAVVPLEQISFLEKNARFMPYEMFQKLVNNIKRDGGLTSVPFCLKRGDGDFLVLSGNHRVMAAKEAGLTEVLVMYTDKELSRQEQIAIQLSHNSLEGKDDLNILKSLWEEIDDIAMKYYSGLDDKVLDEMEKNAQRTLSEVNLEYKVLSFVFLPEELEEIDSLLEKAQDCKGDEVRLTTLAHFERLLSATSVVKAAHNIKNSAVSLELALRVFENHLEDLQAGWVGDEERRTLVPLSTIIGGETVSPDAAKVIKKAVDRMVDSGQVQAKEKWKALAVLASDYLAGGEAHARGKGKGKKDEV